MNSFNAIDVETANADLSSICQIGIAHIRAGQIQDTWKSLIDPEDWFDPWNIDIHGITEEDVETAPTLPDVREELCHRLHGSILVSHTAFDRTAFKRAMDKYGLEHLDVTWLDSAMIARRAWPDKYGRNGWGLSSVAYDLGIDFQHHDALEDAQAAAKIVLHACADTGLDIEMWLDRVKRPISGVAKSRKRPDVRRDGSPDGEWFGENVVFTGRLVIPRREAADRAAQAGWSVLANVTKKTTILVVGMQDRNRLNGYGKSSKHRKAEEYIKCGVDIQILSENDFLAMIWDGTTS